MAERTQASSVDGDRAFLFRLPLEIKARIVELAALQDERYKDRWTPDAPGHELVRVHQNAWRGRSLAMLSETCKELNGLAASHIFKVCLNLRAKRSDRRADQIGRAHV